MVDNLNRDGSLNPPMHKTNDYNDVHILNANAVDVQNNFENTPLSREMIGDHASVEQVSNL